MKLMKYDLFFCFRMAQPWEKPKCQRKVSSIGNQQQLNVVANEKQTK